MNQHRADPQRQQSGERKTQHDVRAVGALDRVPVVVIEERRRIEEECDLRDIREEKSERLLMIKGFGQ